MAARDEERHRLAREIHDDLGSELTALRFALARLEQFQESLHELAEAAPNVTDGTLCDQFRVAIGHAEASLDAAFRASRRLMDERGSPAVAQPVATQLNDWISTFGQRVGLPITFDYKADPRLGPVDEASTLALLRITQEALNNTVKHARATNASVRLSVLVSGLVLVVTDNGRGFAQSRPCALRSVTQTVSLASPVFRAGGVGLQSMRERSAALGGKLELITRQGHGLEVRATLPWRGRVPPERRG